MRIIRSKEDVRIEDKRVHNRVRAVLTSDELIKALSYPHRLVLDNGKYAYAKAYLSSHESVTKLFSYDKYGIREAIELAKAWQKATDVCVKDYLGTVNLYREPSEVGCKSTYRVRVSYFNTVEKRWRSKSFAVTCFTLSEDDEQHMRLTGEAWFDIYRRTGIKSDFSKWRNRAQYDNNKPYYWSSV